ncbi:tol-pal system protein YbgF [Legionella sp. MW5194]|uniref:tol-pal system protein YbgF n=1 Tax=Legionella sp. MW5194 TaxID=2662448 RepID=UPI00193DB79D|nr:tol-pal system protein YbgF [Legionella sp. MW5194]QRN02888.1 tol-pal system protein YbgF [Legionella sp. MW5194]
MMSAHQRLLALFFCCLLPLHSHAEAPVVDDSENFAILDEQQAAMEQSVAKAQLDMDEEIPLAKDDNQGNGDNAELLDKIQGMQQEIQELRGQLEVQAHDLKLLQQQQLAFYKDLDARLRNNPAVAKSAQASTPAAPTELSMGSTAPAVKTPEPAPTPVATPAPQPTPTPVAAAVPGKSNPADEQISYLAAYELVKNKRFDDALTAMKNFVTNYPQGGYTANAHYWLGELYMVKKNYPEAIQHFDVVLKQFPTSSKAAACSLKIGYALAASGKPAEAKSRLQQVIRNYPDTPTAQLAAAKLKSLNAS